MTDDLVKFLLARLDDTARRARAAKPGPWHADGGSVYASHPTDEVAEYTESAEHIAEHDPARVLAEVDAKRRIIDEHTVRVPVEDSPYLGPALVSELVYCPICRNDGECPTLRLLALPYREHPDYRPEWAPEA